MGIDEIVRKLLKFRYKHHGYGRLTCESCGAEASVDYDPYKITREPCSRSCPWHLAETWLKESDENKSSS